MVEALADAAPDRIDENPLPPGDLEESTLAPILKEIHSARRHRRRFRWSGLAAAAICVVAIGLAGFTWLLEPAVALEPLAFYVAPGMEVQGHLIEHARGTEIRLVVSGSQDGQTHRVTLVSEDEERVNSGTFLGTGERTLRGTFNAALLREDTDRLEVRTSGGELMFFAKLAEEPVTVRDWPLFGILPWASPDLQNKTMESSGSERAEGPTQTKPKDDGSGGGTPHKGTSPESGDKGSSPGGEKPGAAPKESEPGRGHPRHQATPLLSTTSRAEPPADEPSTDLDCEQSVAPPPSGAPVVGFLQA